MPLSRTKVVTQRVLSHRKSSKEVNVEALLALDQKLLSSAEQKFRVGDMLVFLQNERQRLQICLHFPFMMFYFIAFSCAVLTHENLKNTAQMTRVLLNMAEGIGFDGLMKDGGRIMSHKTLDDVDTQEDFWQYLDEAMLPRLIHPLEKVNGTSAMYEATRVERQNRLLGGLQIQQQRRQEEGCAQAYPRLGPLDRFTMTNPLLAGIQCYLRDVYTSSCFGPGAGSEGFCPDAPQGADPNRRLFQESHASGVRGIQQPEDSRYSVTFHSHEGLEANLAKMRRLQEVGWLDTSTQWVGIKATIMNPDLALYSQLLVDVWFAPSGQTIHRISITSFPAAPYLDSAALAADIVFALSWLHLLGRCVGGLIDAIMRTGFRIHVKSFWTWSELFCMLGGLGIMSTWFDFLDQLGRVQGFSMDVALNQPREQDGLTFLSREQESKYMDAASSLHTQVTSIANFLEGYRIFICWYTLFIFFRFFEAFTAQPRLTIVTDTFVRAGADMAHFLVVLVSMFLSFAVAGMLLFGHRLLQFAELYIAIHQCFLVFMGEFRYEILSNEHPISGAIWMFCFITFVGIILLNMALAIMMDVYLEVCGTSRDADTVWAQAKKVFDQFILKRAWWSLWNVQVALLELEERKITTQQMKDKIPRMPHEQVDFLAGQVLDAEDKVDLADFSLSDATQYTSKILGEVAEIDEQVDAYIKVVQNDRQLLDDFLLDHPVDPASGLRGHVDTVGFDHDADHRLHVVEKRMLHLEEVVQNAMRTAVSGSKEMRNTLTIIEDMVRVKVAKPGLRAPQFPARKREK